MKWIFALVLVLWSSCSVQGDSSTLFGDGPASHGLCEASPVLISIASPGGSVGSWIRSTSAALHDLGCEVRIDTRLQIDDLTRYSVVLAVGTDEPSLRALRQILLAGEASNVVVPVLTDAPRVIAEDDVAFHTLSSFRTLICTSPAACQHYSSLGRHRLYLMIAHLSLQETHLLVRLKTEREVARRNLRLSEADTCVVASGFGKEDDGFEAVSRAIDAIRLRDGRKDISAVLVSEDGPDQHPFNVQATETEGVTAVSVGSSEELLPYLGAADVYVCNAEDPSNPCHTLLAMAAGLPVLTTRAPASAQPLVVDRGTGLLHYSSTSVRTLADSIVRLHTDKGLAERMGAAGAARAHSLFSPNVARHRWSRFLDRILMTPPQMIDAALGNVSASRFGILAEAITVNDGISDVRGDYILSPLYNPPRQVASSPEVPLREHALPAFRSPNIIPAQPFFEILESFPRRLRELLPQSALASYVGSDMVRLRRWRPIVPLAPPGSADHIDVIREKTKTPTHSVGDILGGSAVIFLQYVAFVGGVILSEESNQPTLPPQRLVAVYDFATDHPETLATSFSPQGFASTLGPQFVWPSLPAEAGHAFAGVYSAEAKGILFHVGGVSDVSTVSSADTRAGPLTSPGEDDFTQSANAAPNESSGGDYVGTEESRESAGGESAETQENRRSAGRGSDVVREVLSGDRFVCGQSTAHVTMLRMPYAMRTHTTRVESEGAAEFWREGHKWDTLPPLPGSVLLPVVEFFDGELHVAGGARLLGGRRSGGSGSTGVNGEDGVLMSHWSLDLSYRFSNDTVRPSHAQWRRRAPLPIPLIDASSVYVGGSWYIFGGRSAHRRVIPAEVVYEGPQCLVMGSPLATVHVYNPLVDSFSAAAPIPSALGASLAPLMTSSVFLSSLGAARTVLDRSNPHVILLGGGVGTDGRPSRDLWGFNTVSAAWFHVSTLPRAVTRWDASVLVHGDASVVLHEITTKGSAWRSDLLPGVFTAPRITRVTPSVLIARPPSSPLATSETASSMPQSHSCASAPTPSPACSAPSSSTHPAHFHSIDGPGPSLLHADRVDNAADGSLPSRVVSVHIATHTASASVWKAFQEDGKHEGSLYCEFHGHTLDAVLVRTSASLSQSPSEVLCATPDGSAVAPLLNVVADVRVCVAALFCVGGKQIVFVPASSADSVPLSPQDVADHREKHPRETMERFSPTDPSSGPSHRQSELRVALHLFGQGAGRHQDVYGGKSVDGEDINDRSEQWNSGSSLDKDPTARIPYGAFLADVPKPPLGWLYMSDVSDGFDVEKSGAVTWNSSRGFDMFAENSVDEVVIVVHNPSALSEGLLYSIRSALKHRAGLRLVVPAVHASVTELVSGALRRACFRSFLLDRHHIDTSRVHSRLNAASHFDHIHRNDGEDESKQDSRQSSSYDVYSGAKAATACQVDLSPPSSTPGQQWNVCLLTFQHTTLHGASSLVPPVVFDAVKPHNQYAVGVYAGEGLMDLQDALDEAGAVAATNPVITADDVTDADAVFVADPFVTAWHGVYHMFFEVMVRGVFHGRIGHAVSRDGYRFVYDREVLKEGGHFSYPYVSAFKENTNAAAGFSPHGHSVDGKSPFRDSFQLFPGTHLPLREGSIASLQARRCLAVCGAGSDHQWTDLVTGQLSFEKIRPKDSPEYGTPSSGGDEWIECGCDCFEHPGGCVLGHRVGLSTNIVPYPPEKFFADVSGGWLLVPEAGVFGKIIVYAGKDFPYAWQPLSFALPFGGADNNIFPWDGRWWILTSTSCGLRAFHSRYPWGPYEGVGEGGNGTSPDDGCVYQQRGKDVLYRAKYSRGGGRVVMWNDTCVRFSQECVRVYGERIHSLQINTLNSSGYIDSPNTKTFLGGPSPENRWKVSPWNLRMHHVDAISSASAYTRQLYGDQSAYLAIVDGNDIMEDCAVCA
eukprot:Rmarinus@m.28245